MTMLYPPSLEHADRQPPRTPEVANQQGLTMWLPVLNEIAEQPHRRAAISCLARQLQIKWGEGVCRVAVGGRHLKRIEDAKLGPLGVESALHHELAPLWSNLIAADRTWLPLRDGQGDVFVMPPLPDGGRLVLWFAEDEVSPAIRTTLPTIAPLLTRIIAGRPWIGLRNATKKSWWTRWRLPILGCLLLGSILMFPVRYRIPCQATVEPVQRRVLAAPFDATVLNCFVRPGSEIGASETAIELDGRPLRLERETLLAEQAQAKQEHAIALAAGKIADARLAELEGQRLRHQIDLIDRKLQQLAIRSPIDGWVLSGDLERSIGATVETGQLLLEIAPLKEMLVEVAIPESEIGFVEPDAPVHVRFFADPHRRLTGTLERVDPAAEIRDHENVFVGRWNLSNREGQIKPGMRGSATILGPRRPLAWRWVRQASEAVLRFVGW